MVSVSLLSSARGNLVSSRFFPYSGFLGLSPVHVDGVVKTRLDADGKPLPAISIVVGLKCTEHILGKLGNVATNTLVDYSQTLWTKPSNQDSDGVGDLELPFHITLPPDVLGFSSVSLVEYRCVWRIEAVINHVHISGVGNRLVRHYEVPLIRMSIPPPIPQSPSPSLILLPIPDSTLPPLRCSLHLPTRHIGPLDMIPVHLRIYPSIDALVVKAASMLIERRLVVNLPSRSTPATLAPQASASSFNTDQCQTPTSSSAYLLSDPSSSARTSATDLQTLVPGLAIQSTSTEVLSKTITTPIVSADSTGIFAHDSADGSWSKTLTAQWPASPSSTRWAVGETLQSNIASVKFFVRIKVTAYLPTGNVSLDVPEQEISVVSTNEAQRQSAMNKLEDLSASTTDRSKSKSPARTRRASGHRPDTGRSHASSQSNSKSMSPPTSWKRPHTSGGPQDQKKPFSDERLRPRENATTLSTSPSSPLPSSNNNKNNDNTHHTPRKRSSASFKPSAVFSIPSLNPSSRHNRPPPPTSVGPTSPPTPFEAVDQQHVKAWEDELRRIEHRSRLRTDFFSFLFRRKPARSEIDARSAKAQGVVS